MDHDEFKWLIGAIVTVGGVIGAAIRWGIGRLVTALDKNSTAHLDSAKAIEGFKVHMEYVYKATREVKDFIEEERSGSHAAPIENNPAEFPVPKRKTPGKGHRASSEYHFKPEKKGDDE